jgi:hypothetical protein
MAMQNERVEQLIQIAFGYIVELKSQVAQLSANDASDAATISSLKTEAAEFKTLYETYMNDDVNQDDSLSQLIDKATTDLEALKAA